MFCAVCVKSIILLFHSRVDSVILELATSASRDCSIGVQISLVFALACIFKEGIGAAISADSLVCFCYCHNVLNMNNTLII